MSRLTEEQIYAAHETFTFREEEIEFEELGGDLLVRELAAGRRAKLLKGLLDDSGNVSDVMEFQCRMFAAACIEPNLTTKALRRTLPKWPASKIDQVLDVAGKLGGDKKEEQAKREAEFHDSDD